MLTSSGALTMSTPVVSDAVLVERIAALGARAARSRYPGAAAPGLGRRGGRAAPDPAHLVGATQSVASEVPEVIERAQLGRAHESPPRYATYGEVIVNRISTPSTNSAVMPR